MQRFIETKLINATPMNRQDYNDFRGWQLPSDENGADEGFLVEYVDGGNANTEQYAGYVSWSPKEVFEKSYRPFVGLTFGEAIEALRIGKKVARAGWNGKGMWLAYVGKGFYDVGVSVVGLSAVNFAPWIGMKTADNKFVPWLASQTDVLAEDWEIVG